MTGAPKRPQIVPTDGRRLVRAAFGVMPMPGRAIPFGKPPPTATSERNSAGRGDPVRLGWMVNSCEGKQNTLFVTAHAIALGGLNRTL